MEHILEDLISKDLSQNFQNMFHGVLGNLWRRIRGLDFDLDLIEIFLEKKLKKKNKSHHATVLLVKFQYTCNYHALTCFCWLTS